MYNRMKKPVEPVLFCFEEVENKHRTTEIDAHQGVDLTVFFLIFFDFFVCFRTKFAVFKAFFIFFLIF